MHNVQVFWSTKVATGVYYWLWNLKSMNFIFAKKHIHFILEGLLIPTFDINIHADEKMEKNSSWFPCNPYSRELGRYKSKEKPIPWNWSEWALKVDSCQMQREKSSKKISIPKKLGRMERCNSNFTWKKPILSSPLVNTCWIILYT